MTRKCYRVVQISDLHLGPDYEAEVHGVRTAATAEQVIAAVAAWAPDRVIASGDLTENGDPDAYRLLIELLQPMKCPVSVLPGNHDDTAVLEQVLADSSLETDDRIVLGEWQLHLLDSRVLGEPGGRLDEASLDALADRLGEGPELVFVHHQPVPVGSAWIDAMGLANGDELVELAARHPTVAALCSGHVHQAVGGWRRGVRWLSAPSTCSQFTPLRDEIELDEDRGPGFRWYELRAGGRWQTGVERLPASIVYTALPN